MMKFLIVLLIMSYNLTILGGTAYLVQVYDWSPWTFLLSLLLLASGYQRRIDDDKPNGYEPPAPPPTPNRKLEE